MSDYAPSYSASKAALNAVTILFANALRRHRVLVNCADPGWVRITWDQALNLIALRLTDIKDNCGPEAVVFSRATTAGSAAIDFDGWLQRLANAFGSPNLLAD